MTPVHQLKPLPLPVLLNNDWLCLYEDILEAGYITLKARLLVEGLDETEAERLTVCCWTNLLEDSTRWLNLR